MGDDRRGRAGVRDADRDELAAARGVLFVGPCLGAWCWVLMELALQAFGLSLLLLWPF